MNRATSTKELINYINSRLDQEIQIIQKSWMAPLNTNTRHFVVNNLLPDKICYEIYNGFPSDGEGFHKRSSFREMKRTSADLLSQKKILSNIIDAFQSDEVVKKVSKIVNMNKLEPDLDLYAGGLSMMFKDDYLNPHIDNSHNLRRNRFRRLNLLYYVTPSWEKEYGGNFELWDTKKNIPKTIVSYFNRLVVMETNKTSWHSVSQVKVDKIRCCVSNYYYSSISPDNTEYFHVTSFRGRPNEKIKTIYGLFDNSLRNFVAKVFKAGRGKKLIRKKD